MSVHSSATHSFNKQADERITLLERRSVEGDAHCDIVRLAPRLCAIYADTRHRDIHVCQIDRDDAADYARDLPLFQASIDFVKGERR